ncbi:MOSC domain-containing protein [Aestuariivirga sp.]|uniref:MOSC domain-containing protein n=1 Tax=Aestuariivirga sp. TaxID=2650926 RepID=UPI0025BA4828|nr:MOSC domain-containing protein [Aestuariivirga sp.]
MPELLTKLPIEGTVEVLLSNPERASGLEKQKVAEARLLFTGMEGDCHGGLTRKSDSRMLKQYKRNTEVRNSRQLSILSVEELAEVADVMGIPAVKPEWVGANLVLSGIPDLTLLPPSTRLQFPSGAMVVVDAENHPCRYPADIIARRHPEQKKGFVAAAMHKRGVVGWVEAEGMIRVGDKLTIWIPPQRIYAHG